MESGSYRSFAKVNLHLQVIGRRPDGYHELRTVFQSIDLCDRISVTAAPRGVELVVTEGADQVPADERNLAWRAAEAYRQRWLSREGVRIELAKRVPVGGGVGGGSSNAATVLRALRDRFGRPADAAELWPVARELGADVPFFLVEGTALGVGRGDEVVPLPELDPHTLFLVTPAMEISTARVFGRLPEPQGAPVAPEVLRLARGEGPRDLPSFGGFNDLQPYVLDWYPELARVYTALLDVAGAAVRLSGTGASLFAWFEEPPEAADLERRLPVGTRVTRTITLSRAEIARRRTAR